MQITNGLFEDQDIILDFNHFHACTFRRCRLTYFGYGPIALENCHFDDCAWGFSGPSANTLSFMTHLYHAGTGARDLIERTIENIRRGGHPHDPINPGGPSRN
jgi:hypothetical protein